MSNQSKAIVITGASSGIGAATAKLLVEQNHQVVLAARNAEKLTPIVAELNQLHANCAIAVPTDVANQQQVTALTTAAIDQFGRIDVWINSAGIMPQSTFIEGRVADWDNMIDINLRGTLYAINSVLPIMRKQHAGQIINIASVAAHATHSGGGVYSATKAAVWMISDALRQEEAAAHSNVRVTVVSPGAVNTGLLTSVTNDDTKQMMQKYYDQFAIGADRIAQAIVDTINLPADTAINEVVIRSTDQV